jgi:glutamate-1-semialdehyde aminotransferase/acyl carrier protein
MFSELSGLGLTEEAAGTSFLELGFDSLFLTQVTQALQGRYGLKITFRQLIDDLSNIDLLAADLDARLPAEAEAVAPAPVAVTPTIAPAAVAMSVAPASAIEAVVREQLQVMSQLMARQLEAFGGAASPAAPRPTAPVPPPSTSAPAAPRITTPAVVTAPQRSPQATAELDARQKRHIEALIARYTARTPRSKAQVQAHRRTLADPRVASSFRPQWKEMVYPLVVDKSRGARLWDLDGNEYIDILNGYGPIMVGHAPDYITKAVEDQLERGFEIGPQTPLAGQVADLVCDLTGMDRVSFCNTGSEAVMAALRLARTVTGRSNVVFFAGAYHGNNGEVLAKLVTRNGVAQPVPSLPGVPPEMVATATVLDYGTPASLDYIRAHASELAAVLVEPVQSRHPGLQPVEFLREIRRITAESGTALIFDEVVTGFRCHPGGAQALFNIKADLATYGKVVGGGLPIGLVTGSSRFMDALDGGYWGYGDDSYPESGVTFFAGTFVRHPLALASALAVLTHLKASGPALQQTLNDKTARLVGEFNRILRDRGVPMQIEHFASLFYIVFPPELKFGSLFYYHMRERGCTSRRATPASSRRPTPTPTWST